MGGLKAVVLGGTGMIGTSLVEQLSKNDRYSAITMLVRRATAVQLPKVTSVIVNFGDENDVRSKMGTGDVIFCALGTTQSAVKGDKDAYRKVDFDIPLMVAKHGLDSGFKSFVLVSSIGADAAASNFYLRLKGQTENALEKLGIPSLHIFRPSLLLGKRKSFRLGEKIAQVIMPVAANLMFGKIKKYRPIQGDTVAAAMIQAATSNKTGTTIYHYDEIRALAGSRAML